MHRTILLIILIMIVAAPASAAVQLSWRDTGYDLAPGYRHTITLTAHYTRFPAYLDGGQAWVQVGPLKASLTVKEDFIGFHYEFEIAINDEKVYSDTAGVHWGSGEVSFASQVEVDCNGNAVVYVDGQQVGAFHVSGETMDILRNTDGDASVTVTAVRSSSCNTSPPSGGGASATPPPPPGGGASGFSSLAAAFGSAGAAAFTIIVIAITVIVIMLVLARLGGAKRLAKSALG